MKNEEFATAISFSNIIQLLTLTLFFYFLIVYYYLSF